MKPSRLIKNSDVMKNSYVMVDGLHTVAEAIKLAVGNDVSMLLVNKRHEHDEYGMVLMSDIARKVLAKDKSPERVNVYEIMIKPVLSVHADMDIRYTARLFERFGINKAPVIEAGKILGVVTYHDIVLKGMMPHL
ncbi:CBS domain-containing protein [Shewanella insulae]|uniref:CBS domain-containing protein n=1 Tax=Shewanella insulae TaxID=2681496 RepID=A0A6L7HVU9_9GAMM|nr:CBS domain-containing protein [Shewanella insulae]MCG9711587.1 CBS domain-containing protein [Shewanella insulae]MCG9737441.1 CBS domain-containing protein [Shewanella insulae]MCG9755075.1 CBS domain-containing protein [Shewanella insulae]MXR68462.1 CBS domain-containing protein [Shewanella insulae]